jgi:hypothetical protein
MSVYNYDSEDFLYGTFNEDKLTQQIGSDEAITTTLLAINSSEIVTEGVPTGDFVVSFSFDGDLSVDEKTALDTLVANHDGQPPISYKYHATSSLVEAKAIVESAEWGYMASAVTTPDFFIANLAMFIGRVIGSYRAVGTGAELRVLEDDEDRILGSFSMADTVGEWSTMQFFSSTPPTHGTHEYILQGRLNGATEAEIRGTSMTILEAVIE